MYSLGSVELRLWLVVFGFLGAGITSVQAAGESSATECVAEVAYLEQVQNFFNPPRQQENFDCFQSIEEADLDQSLIVDLRPPADFEQVRIPGSINLSQSELLNLAPLKTRSLLIIDKGFARTKLSQVCATAKENDFSHFKILLGGIAAWHAAERPLQGLPQHFAELHQIKPRDFFIEAQRNRLTTLATEPYVELLRQIAPPELVVGRLDANLPLDRQLASHIQKNQQRERLPVVVLGMDELPQETSPVYQSVFSLDQSVRQLAAEQRNHLAMVEQRQAIPERYRCGG